MTVSEKRSASRSVESRSSKVSPKTDNPVCQAVHLPWNVLIGEGLLGYGLRAEAVLLTTRLMAAVTQNLKQELLLQVLTMPGVALALGNGIRSRGLHRLVCSWTRLEFR